VEHCDDSQVALISGQLLRASWQLRCNCAVRALLLCRGGDLETAAVATYLAHESHPSNAHLRRALELLEEVMLGM
jgi:hypothetical protein